MPAHEIDYQIFGNDMQIVEVELDPNEAVRAEVGAMMYMEEGIEMQTSTGGGLFSGLKRMFTGDSFFITSFLNRGQGKKKVAFAAPYPGKIIPLDLKALGGEFICQKTDFCAPHKALTSRLLSPKKSAQDFSGAKALFCNGSRATDGRLFIQAAQLFNANLPQAKPCVLIQAVSLLWRQALITIFNSSVASKMSCSAAKGYSLLNSPVQASSICKACPSHAWQIESSVLLTAEKKKAASASVAFLVAISFDSHIKP